MWISLDGDGPLHARVYEGIREGVLEGRLEAGRRLPSTRALAAELGVSRTVVLQAYERLEAEGYTESRVGSGTRVRPDLAGRIRPAPAPSSSSTDAVTEPRLSRWGERACQGIGRADAEPGRPPTDAAPRIDFRYGLPDPVGFPGQVWRRCVAEACRQMPAGYVHAGGIWALRESVSAYLARSRGVVAPPENVLITNGSQQGLDLVARILLDPGDGVAMEEPCYQGARQVFRVAGARLSPVPVDEDGLRTAALPPAGDVRLVCVTPSHQFPTGSVLSLGRRLGLLEWAARGDVWILEDDYDGEFRYDVPPVEAIFALDTGGRVLYAGTFSKVLDPGLRLGYLVLPTALVRPALSARWLSDRHSSVLEQVALARFIDEGHYERHIRRTRARYGKRRRVLLDALGRELGDRAVVSGADAGLHLLAWLPGVPAECLDGVVERARARGLGVYPATPYFGGPPDRAALLLGYSTLDEGSILEGVRILAECLDS